MKRADLQSHTWYAVVSSQRWPTPLPMDFASRFRIFPLGRGPKNKLVVTSHEAKGAAGAVPTASIRYVMLAQIAMPWEEWEPFVTKRNAESEASAEKSRVWRAKMQAERETPEWVARQAERLKSVEAAELKAKKKRAEAKFASQSWAAEEKTPVPQTVVNVTVNNDLSEGQSPFEDAQMKLRGLGFRNSIFELKADYAIGVSHILFSRLLGEIEYLRGEVKAQMGNLYK